MSMKNAFALLLAPMILIGATHAADPDDVDPVTASPEMYTVLFENEHVRVVRYQIPPGARDDWHTHPATVSYVVSGGTLQIHTTDGHSFAATEEAGGASWMEALDRHYAVNTGMTPVVIVLVEVKSAQADPD